MIGSKIAARGDAWEANYTYQINDALSAQVRYVNIDYDYTGSQGFFGGSSGAANSIDDIKDGAAAWTALGGTDDLQGSGQTVAGNLLASQGLTFQDYMMNPDVKAQTDAAVQGMAMAKSYAPYIVESAQDFRFYLRYRF
jgi:hypothetical protein